MKDIPENMFEHINCVICNEKESNVYGQMEDKLYRVPGSFTIVKCSSCGLLFTNPRPNPTFIPELYCEYYDGLDSCSSLGKGSTTSVVKRNPKLRKLYHWLCGQYLSEVLSKARGQVLDIGCGSGSMLEELVQLGCTGYGIEPNPSAVRACLKKGLNVRCGDLDDLDYPDDFFDMVIMWHVIEHLPSPKSTLRTIHRILRPGGSVFIYCPNAASYMASVFHEFWGGWHLPFHFYHFTPDTMSRLLETTGFRTISMRAVTPDFIFPKSLKTYVDNRRKSLQWLNEKGLFLSLTSRLFAGSIFRIMDTCFDGKGECLQLELEKPEGTKNQ